MPSVQSEARDRLVKRHGKVVSELNRALDDARAQGSKMRADLTAALQRVVEGEEEVRAAEQREQRMQQELEASRQREADLHERFAVLYEKEEQLAKLEAALQERCDELEVVYVAHKRPLVGGGECSAWPRSLTVPACRPQPRAGRGSRRGIGRGQSLPGRGSTGAERGGRSATQEQVRSRSPCVAVRAGALPAVDPGPGMVHCACSVRQHSSARRCLGAWWCKCSRHLSFSRQCSGSAAFHDRCICWRRVKDLEAQVRSASQRADDAEAARRKETEELRGKVSSLDSALAEAREQAASPDPQDSALREKNAAAIRCAAARGGS